jgi:hypothetical protein
VNVAVIIPALNEQDCIADTVRRIPTGLAAQIIVADNGSTDATAERARQAGAEVFNEPRRGYGQACLTGLAHLRANIDAVAFLDADGCDNPAEVRRLLDPIAAGDADLVIGSRTAGDARQHLTPQQRFGNALACGLIRIGWGYRYADLGPLRVIRRDALEKLQMSDRTWGWTVEMQIKAVQAGLRIRELPVPYRARVADQSKIAGTLTGSLRAGTKILATIGRYWLAARAKSLLVTGLVLELVGLAAMLPHGDFRLPGAVMFFLLAAAVAVTGYAVACGGAARMPLAWGWAVAIGFRLLLLPMYPSDDIWRYLWEGKIQNLGFSPYALAPASETLAMFRDGYWPLINHPSMAALYPPGAELVFRGLAAAWYHPLMYKLAFVAADLGVVWLLQRLLAERGQPVHRAWWYAWNPLVIYAFAGGGHFDSLMLVCGLASLLCLLRGKDGWSVLLLAAAIACKLAFIVALPFYLVTARRKVWGWVLLGVLALAAVVLITRTTLHPWVEGQKFTKLALVSALGAAVIFAVSRRRPIEGTHGLLGWTLMVSPAFHPWYVTWVLCLTPLVRMKAWWVLAASAFAYFWLWTRVTEGGAWAFTANEKLAIWLPFYLFLVPELTKKLWQRNSSSS